MIAYILGVDVSLTATGLCRFYEDGRATTGVVTSAGRRGDTIAQRADRLATIRQQVALHAPYSRLPVLAVVEGPSFGSAGGSAWDRAGLWWAIVARLHHHQVPVAIVAPTTRAKWATNHGNADKAAVASALTRRYSIEFPSDDEADAGALALMGAHRLGWIGAPVYSTQALAGCVWPDVETPGGRAVPDTAAARDQATLPTGG